MRTATVLAFIAAFLAGCTSVSRSESEFQSVSVKTLHDHPEQWNGRKVEVTGIAVRQFENYGLFEPVDDPCAANPVGIFVEWNDSILPYKTTRPGRFRGVFTNDNGKVQANGDIIISNAAPGPGPLEQVTLVRWDGPKMERCS